MRHYLNAVFINFLSGFITSTYTDAAQAFFGKSDDWDMTVFVIITVIYVILDPLRTTWRFNVHED